MWLFSNKKYTIKIRKQFYNTLQTIKKSWEISFNINNTKYIGEKTINLDEMTDGAIVKLFTELRLKDNCFYPVWWYGAISNMRTAMLVEKRLAEIKNIINDDNEEYIDVIFSSNEIKTLKWLIRFLNDLSIKIDHDVKFGDLAGLIIHITNTKVINYN